MSSRFPHFSLASDYTAWILSNGRRDLKFRGTSHAEARRIKSELVRAGVKGKLSYDGDEIVVISFPTKTHEVASAL